MKREDVGLRVDLLERSCRLDAELAEPIRGHERVVRDDAHPEPERAMGDLAADPSQSEHTERLAGELDSRETCPIPDSGRKCSVCLRQVARQREQERDRMLSCGVDGRLGSVRHDDPAAGCRLDVDVVHADACPSDDLEAVCVLDERRIDRRRRADDDRVVVADDRGEIRLGVLDDIEALP